MPKKITSTEKKDNLNINVYDISGQVTGKMQLPEEIFGVKVNTSLLAQAVRIYLVNQRSGTRKAKTRSEVAGSTRKIYRQKGTGRARHGDIKAPIFKGGGIAHGPKPKDYALSLSQKMRKLALMGALTQKFQNGEIKIISGLESVKSKTKVMWEVLKNLNYIGKTGDLKEKILLITPRKLENLLLAGRNLRNFSLIPVNLINTYEILNHKNIIFIKEAVSLLRNFLSAGNDKHEENKISGQIGKKPEEKARRISRIKRQAISEKTIKSKTRRKIKKSDKLG